MNYYGGWGEEDRALVSMMVFIVGKMRWNDKSMVFIATPQTLNPKH